MEGMKMKSYCTQCLYFRRTKIRASRLGICLYNADGIKRTQTYAVNEIACKKFENKHKLKLKDEEMLKSTKIIVKKMIYKSYPVK
jgi:hypothetical protein